MFGNNSNQVSWSSTGLNIATGDENGQVEIFWDNFIQMDFLQLVVLDVGERLANPGGEASANLTFSLQEMQANKDF